MDPPAYKYTDKKVPNWSFITPENNYKNYLGLLTEQKDFEYQDIVFGQKIKITFMISQFLITR